MRRWFLFSSLLCLAAPLAFAQTKEAPPKEASPSPTPAVTAEECDAFAAGKERACLEALTRDVRWVQQQVEFRRKAPARKTEAAAKGAKVKESVADIEASARKITESIEPVRKALGSAASLAASVAESASSIRTAVIAIEKQLAEPPADVPPLHEACADPWEWPLLGRARQGCGPDGKRVIADEDLGAYADELLRVYKGLTTRIPSAPAPAVRRASEDLRAATEALSEILGVNLPGNEQCAPYLLRGAHGSYGTGADLKVVDQCILRLQRDLDWAVAEFATGQGEEKAKAALAANVKTALARITKALKEAEEASRDPKRSDDVREAVADIESAATMIADSLSKKKSSPKAEPEKVAGANCRDAWLYFDVSIQGCVEKTGERVLQGDASLTEYIEGAHFALGRLDSWHRKLEKKQSPPDPSRQTLEDAKSTAHRLMERMGLRRAFSGVFVPALGYVTTGSQAAPSASPAPSPSPSPGTGASQGQPVSTESESKALGYVAWESKHFGRHENATFDISLAGKFGFQRVFDMVVPEDSPAGATPAPTFQSAFIWDLGLRANAALPGRIGEFGLLGRVGQSRLTEDFTLVKLDSANKQAAVASLATAEGRVAWYYEWGGRLMIFGKRFERAHEHNVLDPTFLVAFGRRRDDRLRGRSELAAYTDPHERYFFQFVLNQLPVLKGNETFKVTFAVEHEWARHGNSLTSGTKLMVQGHLDLVSAFGIK